MDRTQQLLLLNAVAILGVSAYFVVSYDIGGGHVTDRARKSEIPMNSLSGLGQIAGGAVSGSAFRKKWADNDATIPVVSLIALSNGQYWCNRNSLQNACYQDYPHAKLELLLAETSVAPSPLYLAANLTGLWGCVTMRYWWFNSSEPSGPLNPPLGGLRDMLLDAGRGDVLIFMDNDGTCAVLLECGRLRAGGRVGERMSTWVCVSERVRVSVCTREGEGEVVSVSGGVANVRESSLTDTRPMLLPFRSSPPTYHPQTFTTRTMWSRLSASSNRFGCPRTAKYHTDGCTDPQS
jgi:hypothetical protein